MLNFLSGFQTHIIASLVVVLGTTALGGYWYYTTTQHTIAILNADVATYKSNELTLKNEIADQNKSINALSAERVRDQAMVAELAVKYGETQANLDRLQKQFKKHNMSNLTRKKPGLIQKIINRATVRVLTDFEKLSDPTTYVPIGGGSDDKNNNN